MKRNRLWLFLTVLSVLVLALGLTSCAGLPNRGGGGGGGGGGNSSTATLILTISSETRSVQTDFTILAFSAQITSLTLNPALGGKSQNISLSPTPYTVDFNRLTTDSAFLALATVPAAVQFSGMSMALSNIDVTIANPPTGSAIGTCLPGSICQFSPAPLVVPIAATDFPTSFTPNSTNNFYFSVRPNAAVTSSTTGLSVDFSTGSGMAAFKLPRTNQATGTLDSIEDFTGTVSAISGSSITLTSGIGNGSAKGIPLTVGINSSTTFDGCTARNLSCVVTGSVVSLDFNVSTTGALTATEIDLLDSAAMDTIEGTVFPTGSGSFGLVLTDKQVVSTSATTTGATLTAANIGDIFAINGLNTASYSVDTKNLSTQTPSVPTQFFVSSADILSGQTLRTHVSSASGTNAALNQTATVTSAQLRFSRFTATKATASAQLLNLTSLSAIIQVAPPPNEPVVQLYPVTVFDKFTDITTVGGAPGTSNLLSIRALFLNAQNNFYATKIRDQ